MQRSRIPLTNFQYGEISPSLTSRTDSAIYNSSAQTVKNFFLMSEGGVLKRGGFKALHNFTSVTEDTSITQQVRIIPFNFSDDEKYIVALSDGKVEVFFINQTTGAISLSTTLTTDVDSNALPFDEEYLHEITYAQGADIMFLCHSTFLCRKLVRTGLNSFQIEVFEFQVQAGGAKIYQPYFAFQNPDVTLDPSATTGTGVTVTTSSAYFDASHVGTRLYYHDAEMEIKSVQSSTSATVDIIDELVAILDPFPIRTIDGSTTIQITMADHGQSVGDSITIRNASGVGGISATNINGTRSITGIVDENVFEVTAGGTANDSIDGGGNVELVTHAPTTKWYEQSYSSLRGFPSAVGFHENRLWFGGTKTQPDTVWASKTGQYYNFDLGDGLDNDGIELIMSIGEVFTIRHFVSNRDIHIFTDGSEFYIPTFQNQAITPANASVQRQTSFGCTFARPQPFYGATLFTQNGGGTIRQFVFNDGEGAYQSDPVSLLSSHLINNPIQSCVTVSEVGASDAAIFYLNEDGEIVTYNLNRVENIAGWTRLQTSGKFHSVTSVANRLYTVIKTDMGDGTQSFVLCQLDDSLNMDCANTYTGTAGVFDVSDFFQDGAVVKVVETVNYLGEFTVSGGQIDVSAVNATLTSCEVGFGFDVELKTNPIDVTTAIGPMTGRHRTLGSVIINLTDTLNLSVNDTRMILFRTNTNFATGRTAFTGNKEFRLLGYSREPQVTLTQTAPLSLQVNGLVAEVTF